MFRLFLMSASAWRMTFSRYGVGFSSGVNVNWPSRTACKVAAVINALVDSPREAAKSAIACLVALSVLIVSVVSLMCYIVLQMITMCQWRAVAEEVRNYFAFCPVI